MAASRSRGLPPPVIDFDAAPARRGELGAHFAARAGRERIAHRVRDHRLAAGVDDPRRRLGKLRPVAADVPRPAAPEPALEGARPCRRPTPSATSARAKCVRVGRLPSARIAASAALPGAPAASSRSAMRSARVSRRACCAASARARPGEAGSIASPSTWIGPPAPARRQLDARRRTPMPSGARSRRGRPRRPPPCRGR